MILRMIIITTIISLSLKRMIIGRIMIVRITLIVMKIRMAMITIIIKLNLISMIIWKIIAMILSIIFIVIIV